MLCSISTGKSGSKWLERLRSIKGFPTADNLDLDHFLANSNSSDSPTSNPSDSPNSNSEFTHSSDKPLQRRKQPPPEPEVTSSEPGGDREWFSIMRNVLSELFYMGEPVQTSRFSRKKSSRKQTNPRICITKSVNSSQEQKSSSDNLRKVESIPASTTSFSSEDQEAKRESKEEDHDNNVEEEEEDDQVEEEKEKGDKELLGYSRSEVTVIDTSNEVWKVDKLIFRRKNIWKVKEKKGKSRTLGRKKRKAPSSPPSPSKDNNVVVCNKKRKVSSLELRWLKETSGTNCGSPTNHNSPGDDEVQDEALDDLTQVLRKRLPRKSRKGIKPIPSGERNGAKLAKLPQGPSNPIQASTKLKPNIKI